MIISFTASTMLYHSNILPGVVVAGARAGSVGGAGAAVVVAGSVVMYRKH